MTHFKRYTHLLRPFLFQSDEFCDILLNDFIDENPENASIDIFPYVQRAALDMILETAMGLELNMQYDRQSNYAQSIQRIVHIFQQRQILPWYQVSVNILLYTNIYLKKNFKFFNENFAIDIYYFISE